MAALVRPSLGLSELFQDGHELPDIVSRHRAFRFNDQPELAGQETEFDLPGLGVQHLVVSGTSGGSGSYGGVISFTPVAAVPEPAAWAMMILGLGGVGGMGRARRRQATTAI